MDGFEFVIDAIGPAHFSKWPPEITFVTFFAYSQ